MGRNQSVIGLVGDSANDLSDKDVEYGERL
jgi:hypothetical protein